MVTKKATSPNRWPLPLMFTVPWSVRGHLRSPFVTRGFQIHCESTEKTNHSGAGNDLKSVGKSGNVTEIEKIHVNHVNHVNFTQVLEMGQRRDSHDSRTHNHCDRHFRNH